nr:unnamed protein product [Callosobruchus chinensis]
MQACVLLSFCLTAAAASHAQFQAYVPVSAGQYHAQDVLGQYSYGYFGPLSSKSEARAANGVTVGSYKYIDAEGKEQEVQYTADDVHGFQVAATNLPVAPEARSVIPEPITDTPEVAEARARHLEALEKAQVRTAELPQFYGLAAVPTYIAPASYLYSVSPVAQAASVGQQAASTAVHEERNDQQSSDNDKESVEVSAAEPATKSADQPSEMQKPDNEDAAKPGAIHAVKTFTAPTISFKTVQDAVPLVHLPGAFGYSYGISGYPALPVAYSANLLTVPVLKTDLDNHALHEKDSREERTQKN